MFYGLPMGLTLRLFFDHGALGHELPLMLNHSGISEGVP